MAYSSFTFYAKDYMSTATVDNASGFKNLIKAASTCSGTAVIDDRYTISTPVVFSYAVDGAILGKFRLISSIPNNIDQNVGPEITYVGPTTTTSLISFIGCSNTSRIGDGDYGVTINCNQSIKYGIRLDCDSSTVHASNAGWSFERVIVNGAGDGGAGIILTGDITNSEHTFFRCGGYSGCHIKGVKSVDITNQGNNYANGGTQIYYDVMLKRLGDSPYGRGIRANVSVTAGKITNVVITQPGFYYSIGDSFGFTSNSYIPSDLTLGSGFTCSVTKLIDIHAYDNYSINTYPFDNEIRGTYTGYSGGTQITLNTTTSITDYYLVADDGQFVGRAISRVGATTNTWYLSGPGNSISTQTVYAYLGNPTRGAAGIEINNWNSVNIEIRKCGFGLGAQGLRIRKGGVKVYDTNFGPNTDVDVYNSADVSLFSGWTEQSNRFMFVAYAKTSASTSIEDMRIASYPWDFAVNSNFIGRVQSTSSSTNVITCSGSHGLSADQSIMFGSNIGANVTAFSRYYVLSSGLTSTQFKVSTSQGGSSVNLPTLTGVDIVFSNYLSADIQKDSSTYAPIICNRFRGLLIKNSSISKSANSNQAVIAKQLMVLNQNTDRPPEWVNINTVASAPVYVETDHVSSNTRDIFKWSYGQSLGSGKWSSS